MISVYLKEYFFCNLKFDFTHRRNYILTWCLCCIDIDNNLITTFNINIDIYLQALVMAMRQSGEDASVCDSFSSDLELWISHILKRKIKFGKTKIRKTDDYSATPANFVLKHLVRNLLLCIMPCWNFCYYCCCWSCCYYLRCDSNGSILIITVCVCVYVCVLNVMELCYGRHAVSTAISFYSSRTYKRYNNTHITIPLSRAFAITK